MKNRFGENMIYYHDLDNKFIMYDAYNKDTPKVKSVVITDGVVSLINSSDIESKTITVDNSKHNIDKLVKKEVGVSSASYVIVLKLVNFDVLNSNEIKNYYIIREVNAYIKDNRNEVRKIITSLLKNEVDGIKRVYELGEKDERRNI